MTQQPPIPPNQRLVDEESGQQVRIIYAFAPEMMKSSAVQEPASQDIDFLDVAAKAWSARWIVLILVLCGACIGYGSSLLCTEKFKSEVVALPPQARKGSAGLGQFSDLAAIAGVSIPGSDSGSVDEIMAILESRTLREKVVSDFKLQDYYKTKNLEDAARAFSADFSAKQDKKTNRIVFSYVHKSAAIAAEICNSAAATLQERFTEIHQSSSRRERAFLESRLKLAIDESAAAAENFAAFQRENGTVDLDSQTKATVEAIGTLQGQLIGEQVELRALLSSSVNDGNPQVQLLQDKVDQLGQALLRLSGSGEKGGVLIGLNRVPELGIRYLTLFRDVKRGEAMVVTLMAQTESAKIAEVRSGEAISIIDGAVPAQRRFAPRRSAFAGFGAIGGLVLSFGWIFLLKRNRKGRLETEGERGD